MHVLRVRSGVQEESQLENGDGNLRLHVFVRVCGRRAEDQVVEQVVEEQSRMNKNKMEVKLLRLAARG